MKILFAAINSRYTHSNLALRYLRNAVRKTDHDVVIREFSINQDHFGIIDSIAAETPDVIALSVYIWNALRVEALIPDLKKILPDAKIILGGPEAGYDAQRWLDRHPQIDFIVEGAGEAAMQELASNQFQSAERIIHRRNDPFQSIPFPYQEDDFAVLKNRYLYYESSRGCPFSCSYCISSRTDQNLDMKNADTVISELELIIAHNPPLVKFVDRSFNADPSRALVIWQHLISRTPQTRFHFEIHPALIGEEDLAILRTAPQGLFQFEIGVQSVNDAALRAINRSTDWESSRHAIESLIGLKSIHIHLDLIAGLPFESFDDVANTFNEIMKLCPDHFQLGFLKVLPGTQLYDQAEEFGLVYSAAPPYRILSTRWLSMNDLSRLGRIEMLVESIYNNVHLREKFHHGVTRFGSHFEAYNALSEYCERIGFDISTRSEAKIASLFGRFMANNV
jgi:radical SAM superfamily enzyme YgiQ (UPF0313 family)